MNLYQSFRNKTCRKIFGLGIINTDEEGCTQIIPWCSVGSSWRIPCCRQPLCTKDDWFFLPWNVVKVNNFEKNKFKLRKLFFLSFTLIGYIFDIDLCLLLYILMKMEWGNKPQQKKG